MLKGRERFINSCNGEFVGLDVEVSNCVVDELGRLVIRRGKRWKAYSSWIFVEKHFGDVCVGQLFDERKAVSKVFVIWIRCIS